MPSATVPCFRFRPPFALANPRPHHEPPLRFICGDRSGLRAAVADSGLDTRFSFCDKANSDWSFLTGTSTTAVSASAWMLTHFPSDGAPHRGVEDHRWGLWMPLAFDAPRGCYTSEKTNATKAQHKSGCYVAAVYQQSEQKCTN